MYALGGGHGHAVRGALVAAELARRGVACRLLLRAECAGIAHALSRGVDVCAVREPESPAQLLDVVRSAIDAHEASDLLVDTFPEGLLGELCVALPLRRWALLRLRRDALSRRFLDALALYQGIADVEAHLEWLPHVGVVERLGPVARALEVAGEGIALVGDDAELDDFFGRLAPRLARHVPVVRAAGWFVRVPPVVIGPSGYNLTYELARAGAHHLAIPRPRAFDDQRRRAAAVAEVVESPEALERRALVLVRERALRPRIAGGAARVVDWLSVHERQAAAL